MATRKQREIIRQRRMAFDRTVEANRKNADLRAETGEPTNIRKQKKNRLNRQKKAHRVRLKPLKGKRRSKQMACKKKTTKTATKPKGKKKCKRR